MSAGKVGEPVFIEKKMYFKEKYGNNEKENLVSVWNKSGGAALP